MFGRTSSGAESQAAHASAAAQSVINEFIFITGSVRQIVDGNGIVTVRQQVFVTMCLAYDAGTARQSAEYPRRN